MVGPGKADEYVSERLPCDHVATITSRDVAGNEVSEITLMSSVAEAWSCLCFTLSAISLCYAALFVVF